MRFVGDHQIDRLVVDGREHLIALDEVDRRDRDGVPRPRTDARRQRRDAFGDRRLIEHGRGDAESIAQLTRPGVAKAGRADDQRVLDPSALAAVPTGSARPGSSCRARRRRPAAAAWRRRSRRARARVDTATTRSTRLPPSTDTTCRVRRRSPPAPSAAQPVAAGAAALRFATRRGRSNGSMTRRRSPAFDRSRPSSVSSAHGIKALRAGQRPRLAADLEQRSWLVRRHAGMAAKRPPDRDDEIRAAVATCALHTPQFLRSTSREGRRRFCATSMYGWR